MSLSDCLHKYLYIYLVLFIYFEKKFIKIDQIIKQIGKGSFGKVYLVFHKKKKRHFVLKAIPLTDPKETEVAQKEVKMLQLFNNPFIVRYNDNFIDQKQFCIVMEYCDDGDLNGYFQVCKQKRVLIPETVCY